MNKGYDFAIIIIAIALISACSKRHDANKIFEQCLTHYEKQELEKAGECFKKLIHHSDFHIQATFMLGRVRYFQNNFAEARKLFDSIISTEPSHTGARYWLARALSIDPSSENIDARENAAIEHLKKILEIDPYHVRARSLLALLYEKHKKYREALHEYLAALQEEETLVITRANLGILYHRLGLSDRARTELDRAISISKAADIPAKNLLTIKEELMEK